MKRVLLVLFVCLICGGVNAYPVNSAFHLSEYDSTSKGADVDFYTFTIKSSPKKAEQGVYVEAVDLLPSSTLHSLANANILFGLFKKNQNARGSTSVNEVVGPGSFTFFANTGAYKAFVSGFAAGKTDIPYHLQIPCVSAVPEPASWALMLLGVVFVIRQIRRRPKQYRPWKTN